jgi:hypothetical protein
VDVGEALLHAINEEFVEAVEILLHYQDHGQVNDVIYFFLNTFLFFLSSVLIECISISRTTKPMSKSP